MKKGNDDFPIPLNDELFKKGYQDGFTHARCYNPSIDIDGPSYTAGFLKGKEDRIQKKDPEYSHK